MDTNIMSRQQIAADAELAARFVVAGGVKPKCNYPDGSDARAAWEAAFKRFLLNHSAPDADGSA